LPLFFNNLEMMRYRLKIDMAKVVLIL
jgi:hypothetical protein